MIDEQLLQKVRRIAIFARRKALNLFAGNYHSVFRGRGVEFEEVREYQYGDDTAAIDWNVTARTSRLHIKRFKEERELTTVIAVDLSSSMHFFSGEKSKIETASEIAAILSYTALLNNDKVGLLLFTDKAELFIPPRKGKAHVLRIIREIISFSPTNSRTNLENAFNFLNQNLKKRSIIFFISDFRDFKPSSALSICKKKHDLIALEIYDRLEKVALPKGDYILFCPERDKLFRIALKSKRSRQQLAFLSDQQEKSMLNALRRLKIDHIQICCDQDYLNELIKFFLQRRQRR